MEHRGSLATLRSSDRTLAGRSRENLPSKDTWIPVVSFLRAREIISAVVSASQNGDATIKDSFAPVTTSSNPLRKSVEHSRIMCSAAGDKVGGNDTHS